MSDGRIMIGISLCPNLTHHWSGDPKIIISVNVHQARERCMVYNSSDNTPFLDFYGELFGIVGYRWLLFSYISDNLQADGARAFGRSCSALARFILQKGLCHQFRIG